MYRKHFKLAVGQCVRFRRILSAFGGVIWDMDLAGPYRASVLIQRGPSPELESILDWGDGYAALRLGDWADRYRATH